MDVILIEGLRCQTFIGVYARERVLPQAVDIDLTLAYHRDLTDAPVAGLAETIDYHRLVLSIEESLKDQHFDLIEQLAEHIAELCRRDFAAPWVRVMVGKPAVLKAVKRVGVVIERGDGTVPSLGSHRKITL